MALQPSPYQYPTPQANPYVASIGDLMLRQGDIRANEALQLADINAKAITGVASAVGSIPGQIQQAKAAQLGNQVKQAQLTDANLDITAKQRAVKLQTDLSDVVTNTPQIDESGLKLYDVPGITKALAAKGYGQESIAIGQHLLETNDSYRRVQTSKIAAGQQIAQKLVAAGAPPDLTDHVIDTSQANGLITASDATSMHDLIKADPANALKIATYLAGPQKMENRTPGSMAGNPFTGALVPGSQVPFEPKDVGPGGELVQAGANGQPPTVLATNTNAKPAETPQPGSEADAVARARLIATQKQDGKPLTPEQTQTVDAKAMQDYKSQNVDPEVRAATLASKNLADAMRQMQLAQMPTKEQAHDVAVDLLAHRLAPEQLSQMFGGMGAQGQLFKRMVYTESKQIDPTFNFEESASEYQLAKSPAFQQTVRYMDYVGASSDTLIKNADILANGKVRSINALVNAGKDQFNSVNLAKFNTDRLEYADAVAKILQGGGTGSGTSDAKLKQAQDLIRQTDDPAVVRATVGEIDTLMGKRRSTLTKGTYLEHAAPAAPQTPNDPMGLR